MAEYIEREALIAEYDRVHEGPAGGARKLMVDAPAVDVVEVKHGENITKKHPVDEFICSECGLIMRDLTEVRIEEDNEDECYFEFEVKFCPNCGVKIRERD